jgi:hypothetical protein
LAFAGEVRQANDAIVKHLEKAGRPTAALDVELAIAAGGS